MSPKPAASVHVALLRGINVGGRHKLPMNGLRAIFSDLGCLDVQTVIQSGNVVFQASAKLARTLPADVASRIEADLGFGVPVQLRSGRELRRALEASPFLTEDPSHLHVLFLANKPTKKALAGLDPERSPGDRYQVIGQEIHLCCPNGLARTKLTNAYFDSRLSTISSARNWKTLAKLLALTT